MKLPKYLERTAVALALGCVIISSSFAQKSTEPVLNEHKALIEKLAKDADAVDQAATAKAKEATAPERVAKTAEEREAARQARRAAAAANTAEANREVKAERAKHIAAMKAERVALREARAAVKAAEEAHAKADKAAAAAKTAGVVAAVSASPALGADFNAGMLKAHLDVLAAMQQEMAKVKTAADATAFVQKSSALVAKVKASADRMSTAMHGAAQSGVSTDANKAAEAMLDQIGAKSGEVEAEMQRIEKLYPNSSAVFAKLRS